MTSGLFVTGTDTVVGKTVASVALLRSLADAGVRCVGMKPVAAGIDAGQAVNDDVLALAAAANVDAPLRERNPYAFADPVAPHLAAARAGAPIALAPIVAAYGRLAARADAVVVEGAGGPLVPLNERNDMLDIARALRLPVVLVVGLRLGCLSHARLAALAIRARGLTLAGWIACRVDPRMALVDANVAFLRRDLPAPMLADLHGPRDGRVGAEALALLGFPAQR
jgi:dethiobiotin synthetase